MSSERINGQRAKNSRKTMRERVPSLQNSKQGHHKWAASPPTLRAGFSSFGSVERARASFFSRFSHAGHKFFPTTIGGACVVCFWSLHGLLSAVVRTKTLLQRSKTWVCPAALLAARAGAFSEVWSFQQCSFAPEYTSTAFSA